MERGRGAFESSVEQGMRVSLSCLTNPVADHVCKVEFNRLNIFPPITSGL